MDTGFLQLLVIFISTKASEITVRKYEKLDNLILDDYILSKFANNVSSKLKCALLCAEQDCGCVSYVFEKSTKTCRMYSDKFSPQPSGGVTGYVDRSECLVPPSYSNTAVVWSCVSDVATATYTCNTDLYSTIGDPAISCTWSTGQWSAVQFQCQGVWMCYHFSQSERDTIGSGVEARIVCETNGKRYTEGDDAKAPGCGNFCYCCQRV